MSRKLSDLNPVLWQKCLDFISACQKKEIYVLVDQTLRTNQEQDELYASGRTKPGKILTKAKGGDSYHNYGLAFDIAIMVNGKPNWGNMELYRQAGEIGQSVGLEWGGSFTRFPDYPHYQFTFGLSIAELKGGKVPPDHI